MGEKKQEKEVFWFVIRYACIVIAGRITVDSLVQTQKKLKSVLLRFRNFFF